VADRDRSGFSIPGLTLQRVVTATALFIVVYSGFTVAGNAARSYELKNQTQQLQQQIASDQNEYQRLDALRRLCRWARSTGRRSRDVVHDVRPVRTVRNGQPAGSVETRQVPIGIRNGVMQYTTITQSVPAPLGLAEDFCFTRQYTDRPVKFSFTGPFSLSRALAQVLNAEARALAQAGATTPRASAAALARTLAERVVRLVTGISHR